MKSTVGMNKVDVSILTFICLALCVVSGSLCVGSAAQPESHGVIPNHRVAQHTRTQGPLLLFLLPAFLLLVLSLVSGLSPLLSGRGGAELPPLLGVAVGGRWLLVVGAYREKW